MLEEKNKDNKTLEEEVKKVVKNLTILGGASAAAATILAIGAGLSVVHDTIHHDEKICIMTKLFGVNHQIREIDEETKGYYMGLYNDKITYMFEECREEEVTVYEGNAEFTKIRLVPETYTKTVEADDDEIKIVNTLTGDVVKTLKLK